VSTSSGSGWCIYFAPFLRRVVFVGEALCLRFSRGRSICGGKVGLCEFV
jgi:hypothetical protein